MIEKSRFEKLKNQYGSVSSWTIWELPTESIKSNTSNISFFEKDNITELLNDKYVFVGLNASSTHGNQGNNYWINFHSNYKYQNDYKLRYALMNTKFWGSYITDVIKNYKEVDSSKVMKHLKNNPLFVQDNINDFENELSILSKEKPILIAIGNDSFNILNKYLGKTYKIVKIPHYSMQISKENYKKEVLNVLNQI